MSQRPPASRPASRSPPDGQMITLPAVQLRDDPHQQGGRPEERHQTETDGRRSFSQQPHPSPQHAQPSPLPGEEWRSAPSSRDLGVHSMLNPTEPEGATSSKRRPLSATASPLSAIGPPPPFGASPSTAPANSFPGQQISSSFPTAGDGYPHPYHREPRHILTPRSPSRAVSGNRGYVHATIDAHQSPFLPGRVSRAYMAEPGPFASSDVPPMPSIPPGAQPPQYGYPSTADTPATGPRRASGGNMQAPGRTPLSESASPSISASSHNPSSSQTSPASFLYNKGGPPLQPASGYFPGSSFAASMQHGPGGVGMQLAGPSGGGGEGPYTTPTPQAHSRPFRSSSADSSRQTSASDPIQSLTFSGPEGSYQVPVDFHQASRLADEKRARNAGASARFRQRRKEKEKEASTSIEKLQQQTRDLERKVREVEQERDFYRSERDRFRDVVYRTPETRHLAGQGPPSPQTGRPPGGQGGQFPGSMPMPMPVPISISQMGGPPPPPPAPPPPPMGFQAPGQGGQGLERERERGTEGGPERPPRRRRTDTHGDYTSLPYSHPPSSTLPPVQAAFASGPVAQSLPPLRIEHQTLPPNTSIAPNPSSSTTAPPQPPSYSPYSRGPFERRWPGDSGGRRQ